jgi:hypothetical protein
MNEEFRKFQHESNTQSARTWLETLVKRREDEARELRRFLERFDEAVADESKPERKGWDTTTSVLSSAVHMAAQAGSNDRLDLAVNYAVSLARSKS